MNHFARTACGFGSLALIAALPLINACTTEAYCYSCENGGAASGGDGGGGSGVGSGGSGGDADIDIPTNGGGGSGNGGSGGGGGESCGDTQSDAKNCGTCGNVCVILGAYAKCVEGKCTFDECAPGNYDINGNPNDGCEYPCTITNEGIEICDGLDNNCDGNIDEDFDLTSDINNCGKCGNVCTLTNATSRCDNSGDFPTCAVDECADGYSNADGDHKNGCEYSCPVWPPEPEKCNAIDDNCDGRIDEDNPEGGALCQDNCPGGKCQGMCTPGIMTCIGTVLVCVPGLGPSLEICDGLDNDCDGVIDNGFDLMNDPLNCGICGKKCEMSNGFGGCVLGECVTTACMPGWANVDGDDSNGCEYKCPVYPPSIETCNGIDDDCDGYIDDEHDALALAAQKPDGALCDPHPAVLVPTPCKGVDFKCMGTAGWKCQYGPQVEVDPLTGKVLASETKCDGFDGNCNGQIDEKWPERGNDCWDSNYGACRNWGKRVCDTANPSQTICDFSLGANPIPGAPMPETCNDIDDDCDGIVDNGVVDDMVEISYGGLHYWIDRYEASRPDATDTDPGEIETRRCVASGVIPWTYANYAEANRGCEDAGKRLCTADEIMYACAAGVPGEAGSTEYPYGDEYEPLTCNGLDYDGVKESGTKINVLIPTGDLLECRSADDVYDLSGNATEWTSTSTASTSGGLDIYWAIGGSYETPELGLSCGFAYSRFAETAILGELGFRCCSDTAPDVFP